MRDDERDLIAAMLNDKPSRAELISSLDARTVQDVQDGGMGSIRFFGGDSKQQLGAAVAEGEYTDGDGVQVSISS